MLAKTNPNAIHPVAINNSIGVARQLQATEGRTQDAFETPYLIDPMATANDDDALLMLWGDVSISARHPSRIAI